MVSEVLIRPIDMHDIATISRFDPGYNTDYVWQMDLQNGDNDVSMNFRTTRLPRTMRVEYPRSVERITREWQRLPAALVAEKDGAPAGYIGLRLGDMPGMVNVIDLVVDTGLRRQSIGTQLLMAASNWAVEQGNNRMMLEVQSKNYPAICLAQKLGFEFCGYCDQCYMNQDIALYFCRRL